MIFRSTSNGSNERLELIIDGIFFLDGVEIPYTTERTDVKVNVGVVAHNPIAISAGNYYLDLRETENDPLLQTSYTVMNFSAPGLENRLGDVMNQIQGRVWTLNVTPSFVWKSWGIV